VQTLASLTLSNRSIGVITIGMGAHGALSRVLFPALGSLMTYTFIGVPTAPGQLELEDTCRLLRTFYPNYAAERPVTEEPDE
jgi:3-dehydroquinate dehydratase-1